jgi:O-antigen/teichoic acid export membrane protein
LNQNFSTQQRLVRSLATHSAIGTISLGVIDNIDILFVQAYLNTYEAGLLGGVSRIALLFNLMAYSLSTVLNPRAAKYRQFPDVLNFFKKSWVVTGLSAVGFALFLPFTRHVIQFSIGPEYLPGTFILTILMAAAFITIAAVPFTALFFSLDVPWYFSLSGLAQLVIILVGNAVFVPEYGLAAAAWTRLGAKIFLLVFTILLIVWIFRKQHQKSLFSFPKIK